VRRLLFHPCATLVPPLVPPLQTAYSLLMPLVPPSQQTQPIEPLYTPLVSAASPHFESDHYRGKVEQAEQAEAAWPAPMEQGLEQGWNKGGTSPQTAM
jgi:hypothetical protein